MCMLAESLTRFLIRAFESAEKLDAECGEDEEQQKEEKPQVTDLDLYLFFVVEEKKEEKH